MSNIYGEYSLGFPERAVGDIYATPIDERPGAEGKVGYEYFEYYYNNSYYGGNGVNRLLTTTQGSGFDYSKYNLHTIYELLIAKYAESHVRCEEDLFKTRVCQLIWQYGPDWQRQMATNDNLLTLTEAQLAAGNTNIYNHAAHPSTAPTTQSRTELGKIDNQSVQIRSLSKLETMLAGYKVASEQITKDFIDKFKPLMSACVYKGLTGYVITED